MSKSLGNFTNLLDLIEHDRPARLPAAGAAGATTARRSRSTRTRSRRRPRRCAGSTRSRRRAPSCRRPSPTPACSTRSARAWTTTSTRPGAMAVAVRRRHAGPTPPPTPATTARAPARAGRRRRSIGAGRRPASCAADDEVPGRRSPPRSPPSTPRARRQGLRHRRRPPGRRCRPTGWVVEATAAGTAVRPSLTAARWPRLAPVAVAASDQPAAPGLRHHLDDGRPRPRRLRDRPADPAACTPSASAPARPRRACSWRRSRWPSSCARRCWAGCRTGSAASR